MAHRGLLRGCTVGGFDLFVPLRYLHIALLVVRGDEVVLHVTPRTVQSAVMRSSRCTCIASGYA